MDISFLETCIDIREAYNSFELQIDSCPYMESVGDVGTILDNMFKAVVHTIHMLDAMHRTKIYTNDTVKMIKFLKSTIKKYPNVGRRKIIFRKYGDAPEDSIDTLGLTTRNIATRATLLIENPRLYELLKGYHFQTGYKDTFYKVTIKEAITYLEACVEELDNFKRGMIKSLFDFKERSKAYKNEKGFIETMKEIFKHIADIFKRRIEISGMNIEAFMWGLTHSLKDEVKEISKTVRKKKISDDEIIEKSTECISEFDMCGKHFKVFKTNQDDTSCFITEEYKIYIDNRFFKLPLGYQKAILFHEVGHAINEHFGNRETVKDEFEQAKSFFRDAKKFDRMVAFSPFGPSESFQNDEELLYILIELEADRFSSKQVGKKLMTTSLDRTFKSMMQSTFNLDDEDDYMRYLFNLERNKFRVNLI